MDALTFRQNHKALNVNIYVRIFVHPQSLNPRSPLCTPGHGHGYCHIGYEPPPYTAPQYFRDENPNKLENNVSFVHAI